MAKSQTERTNEYRRRLIAERDALRLEVADLNRRLAEATDTPATPSLLDQLTPAQLAELEILAASGKLAVLLDRNAQRRAEQTMKAAPTTVASEPPPETAPALQDELRDELAELNETVANAPDEREKIHVWGRAPG